MRVRSNGRGHGACHTCPSCRGSGQVVEREEDTIAENAATSRLRRVRTVCWRRQGVFLRLRDYEAGRHDLVAVMVIPDAVTAMTGLSRVLASARALSYVPGSVEWADFDPAATATAITTTDAPQRLPAAALAVGAGPRDITPGQPLLGP